MNEKYSEKVIDHFMHPRNIGEISKADAVAEVVNPICNDTMKVYLKIENGIIQDAKFKTMGCAAAIASSDITCDIVKGKTLEEAKNLTKEDIVKSLGGLPDVKVHCSLLGEEAIKKAIRDFEKKLD